MTTMRAFGDSRRTSESRPIWPPSRTFIAAPNIAITITSSSAIGSTKSGAFSNT